MTCLNLENLQIKNSLSPLSEQASIRSPIKHAELFELAKPDCGKPLDRVLVFNQGKKIAVSTGSAQG